MHQVKTIAAQGDVIFERVDALPENAAQQSDKGDIVVAHSETGHHHTVDVSQAIRFEVGNPLVCYLQIDDTVPLIHHRSFDTHAPFALTPGIWRVRRQREAQWREARRVQD